MSLENRANINLATYLDERVDDQINWYDRKSVENKRGYRIFSILQLLLAIAISCLVFYTETDSIRVVVSIFSATILFVTMLLGSFKFNDNWHDYRVTAEALKHEKYYYLTRSGHYSVNGSFEFFVENIEKIVSKNHSQLGVNKIYIKNNDKVISKIDWSN